MGSEEFIRKLGFTSSDVMAKKLSLLSLYDMYCDTYDLRPGKLSRISLEKYSLSKENPLHDATPMMSFHDRLPFNSKETAVPPFILGLFKVLAYVIIDIHQPILDVAAWPVFYLRDVVFENSCKENNLARFPFKEKTVSTWFQEERKTADDATPRTVHMLNLNSKILLYPIHLSRVGNDFSPNIIEEGVKILCHGTSHESFVNIFHEGIKLGQSEENGDFSTGNAFYLADFEKAVEWGFEKSSGKVAVLVFKVPNEDIETFRGRSLDLMGEEKEQRWLDVVRNTRSKELRTKSFIEGPWIDHEHSKIKKKIYKQKPGSYQMCILDKELAKVFDRNLHSVIFYNTKKK